MSNPQETANASSPMEAFFTRQRANEGVKLDLEYPDGRKSPHWIKIRGIDSDVFKAADAAAKRKAFEIATAEDKTGLMEKILQGKLELIAVLVIDWSFEQPPTIENIVKFFKEAPQIVDEIDTLASRRRLFFGKGSTPSTPTPAPSSS